MRKELGAALATILLGVAPASAHRLDEYLQATLLSVQRDDIHLSMRLVPGVAVAETVITDIDTNRDGILSESERRSYAMRVLRDLSLNLDGIRLKPRLLAAVFPKLGDMREGVGEIRLEFAVDLPNDGVSRELIFENHHQSSSAAYLVNCLVPRDKAIRIQAQNRNKLQSFYRLEYVQAGAASTRPLSKSSGLGNSLRRMLSPAPFWFNGFAGMYRLGIRHIAEGTDHLLFLLTVLLPAPLLVRRSRWAMLAGVRHSVLQILKIVTAFTIGHSITLALAGVGVVHVPGRPIETLIAVSIFVSAIHAIRPLFPGREAFVASFFGLIHGLAFATTLSDLGLRGGDYAISLFGFNLGIETMQLTVVAVTMPSLLLLSRTHAYPPLRISGALFAGMASVGWIAERLFNVHTSVDLIVNGAAQYGVWIAGSLSLTGLLAWSLRNVAHKQTVKAEAMSTTILRNISPEFKTTLR